MSARWKTGAVAVFLSLGACSSTSETSSEVDHTTVPSPTAAGPGSSSGRTPPTLPSATPDATETLSPALQGVRWIVVERDGQRWQFAYAAYLEFAASEMAGAVDHLYGGNDGCNWYGALGSLHGDQLAVDEVQSTAMDCGPGTGGALPRDGERLHVSADGTLLDVLDDGRSRLTFTRADRLFTVSPDDIIGSWQLDPGDDTLAVGSDGVMTFGTCQWSWSLDQTLAVTGLPSDPYECLVVMSGHTPSRLVEMFVNGPVDVGRLTDGDLYLADDQFVIRLIRQPAQAMGHATR